MAVFFSGTDMAELNDNAPAHNFYLSLIVNNYMDFIAKVAFIGEAKRDIKQVPYTAKNVDGHDYTIEKQDFEVNTKKLFIYDCEIDAPINKIIVSEQFTAQVAKIMEPKPVKKVESRWPVTATPTTGNRWQRNDNNSRQFRSQQEREMESFNKSYQQPKGPYNNWEDWGLPATTNTLVDNLDVEELKAESIYNFAKSLFDFTGGALDEDETLEDVLDVLAEFQLTPAEIAKSVIDSYAKDFSKHFPNASAADFVQYTSETIDLLEDVRMLYPEIGLTIKTIDSMITKFVESETKR